MNCLWARGVSYLNIHLVLFCTVVVPFWNKCTFSLMFHILLFVLILNAAFSSGTASHWGSERLSAPQKEKEGRLSLQIFLSSTQSIHTMLKVLQYCGDLFWLWGRNNWLSVTSLALITYCTEKLLSIILFLSSKAEKDKCHCYQNVLCLTLFPCKQPTCP